MCLLFEFAEVKEVSFKWQKHVSLENASRRINTLPLWLLLSVCGLFTASPSAPLVTGLLQPPSINFSTSFCLLQPSSNRRSSVLAVSSLLLSSSVCAAPCDTWKVKTLFQINIAKVKLQKNSYFGNIWTSYRLLLLIFKSLSLYLCRKNLNLQTSPDQEAPGKWNKQIKHTTHTKYTSTEPNK